MAKRVDKSQLDVEDYIFDLVAADARRYRSIIRTVYDGLSDEVSQETSVICPPPTEEEFSAIQSFRDEADINLIVKRMESGQFDDFYEKVESGHYFDLTRMPDYTDAMQKIAAANSEFEQIPAHIRKEFENSPAKFVAFIDKGDRSEFERLGLVSPQMREEALAASPAPTPPETKSGASDA